MGALGFIAATAVRYLEDLLVPKGTCVEACGSDRNFIEWLSVWCRTAHASECNCKNGIHHEWGLSYFITLLAGRVVITPPSLNERANNDNEGWLIDERLYQREKVHAKAQVLCKYNIPQSAIQLPVAEWSRIDYIFPTQPQTSRQYEWCIEASTKSMHTPSAPSLFLPTPKGWEGDNPELVLKWRSKIQLTWVRWRWCCTS